jgi:hypothetical protein
MTGTHHREQVNFNELPDPVERLSATGEARRETMRDSLELAVRSRGRRRLAVRGGLVACGLAFVAGAVVTAGRPAAGPGAGPIDPGVSESIAVDVRPEPRLEESKEATVPPTSPGNTRLVAYVTNDAGIVDRLAVNQRSSRVEMLDDHELLAQLRAAGLPAGLVRRDERLSLAFHNAPRPVWPDE